MSVGKNDTLHVHNAQNDTTKWVTSGYTKSSEYLVQLKNVKLSQACDSTLASIAVFSTVRKGADVPVLTCCVLPCVKLLEKRNGFASQHPGLARIGMLCTK